MLAPSPDDIDAVVFDMGGVFTIPRPETMIAVLADAGIASDIDGEAARRAHYHGVRGWSEFHARQGRAGSQEEWWRIYDRGYFGSLGFEGDALRAAVEAHVAARPRYEVASVWSRVLVENRAGFRSIARRRPVAIVTNNNGTAVEQCANAELCQVGPGAFTEVAAIVDSTIVGVSKPDPAIFEPALDALGTDPARTLYVGDTVHADVEGADRAGMRALQLDPFDLHADHSHWRLPGVTDLASILGVPGSSA